MWVYYGLDLLLSKLSKAQSSGKFHEQHKYEVGSITNANGLISQQIRNIAKQFKKAATTTFISCAEKKSFVC